LQKETCKRDSVSHDSFICIVTTIHLWVQFYLYLCLYVWCICIYTHTYIYIHIRIHMLKETPLACPFTLLAGNGICVYMYIYVWCIYIYMHTYENTLVRIPTHIQEKTLLHVPLYSWQGIYTGWRRLIGSLKLQIIFHKRATKYRSLLRKMTYKDKGSYESSPPCTYIRIMITYVYIYLHIYTWTHMTTHFFDLSLYSFGRAYTYGVAKV